MELRTSGMSDDLFRRFRVQDTKAEAIVRLLGVLQQRRRLPLFFFPGSQYGEIANVIWAITKWAIEHFFFFFYIVSS